MSYESGFMAATSETQSRALYRRAVNNLDPMTVLDRYNAKNVHQRGDEILHSCIVDTVHRHHTRGDQDASASMKAKGLLWNCWSYGGGDLLWLIQEMEGVNRDGAMLVLSELLVGHWDSDTYDVKEVIRDIYRDPEKVPIPRYHKAILKPWLAIHPYMTEERHIDESTLIRYRIGYDAESDKIVIPHFWKGVLVGWQKRRLASSPDEPGNPKYKNSTDFPRQTTLFNFDVVRGRGHSDIVLVESPMSVLRAETLVDAGFGGYGNFVATFGAALTRTQLELLKGFDSVTVWYDGDKAGIRGALKVYESLKRATKVSMVKPHPTLDPADFDQDDLDEMLRSARLGALIRGWFVNRIAEIR